MTNLLPFWMENYFKHPSYLKIDGKPLLFVYRPEFLVQDLGGVENAAKAFARMRQACKDAGFAGLVILGEYRGLDPNHLRLMKQLGLDYTFAYCWHVQNSPTPEQAIQAQMQYIKEYNYQPWLFTGEQRNVSTLAFPGGPIPMTLSFISGQGQSLKFWTNFGGPYDMWSPPQAVLRHDPANRIAAMELAQNYGTALHTGVFFRDPSPDPSYEAFVAERRQHLVGEARDRKDILNPDQPGWQRLPARRLGQCAQRDR